jgi:hypothetical protein
MAHIHTALCPDNPVARELIMAVLTEGCAPGEAVGGREYQDRRAALSDPPTHGDLLLDWAGTGKWGEMLSKLGLKPAPRTSRRQAGEAQRMAAIVDQVACEKEEADRLLEQERLGGYGLAVCSVRQLPDGRFAYALR